MKKELHKLENHKDLLEYIISTVDFEKFTDKDKLNKLLDYVFNLSIKVARDDFYTFVKLMMPSMIPESSKITSTLKSCVMNIKRYLRTL